MSSKKKKGKYRKNQVTKMNPLNQSWEVPDIDSATSREHDKR